MPNNVTDWTLKIGSAIGYGRLRDMGTAPISFTGPALQTNMGLWYDRTEWQFHLDIVTILGYYEDVLKPVFNFSTFDINSTIRIKALHRIYPFVLTHEWVGMGLSNFIDVTVNTNYENAATGISEFLGPELYLRGIQSLGYGRWQLFGEIGVMPLAAVLRPGYAYIDNYTATQPVLDAVFNDYKWDAKFMAAISTKIGFYYLLRNNNKIELVYCWEYHNSGKSGMWRFDHAMHTLQINVLFNLKRSYTYGKNKD